MDEVTIDRGDGAISQSIGRCLRRRSSHDPSPSKLPQKAVSSVMSRMLGHCS
jgi:hypothetical protein